jgi:hypothetical protein
LEGKIPYRVNAYDLEGNVLSEKLDFFYLNSVQWQQFEPRDLPKNNLSQQRQLKTQVVAPNN